MVSRRPILAALLWLAAFAASAAAQEAPEITVRLDPSRVSLGGTTDLIVEVAPREFRADVEEPVLPPLPAVVLGSSRASQVEMVGTDVTRRVVFRWRLQPLGAGRLRIDPLEVLVDGRAYRTPALDLVVLDEGGVDPVGPLLDHDEPLAEAGPPAIFAVTRLDRERVYVGEPATLTFAFYHDPRLPLAESPDYDPPETPGVWRVELDAEPRVDVERIGRRTYQVQRFRYALYPLRPGQLTIGPARVRVVEPDPSRWWRGGRARTIATEPLQLAAEPLPAGAPPGFGGAVGRYRLAGGLSERATTAGIPLELELSVTGPTQPTAVAPPSLPAWPDIQIAPPVVEAADPSGRGRGAARTTFRWLLSPREVGTHDLGVARFAYFDPAAGAYAVDSLELGEIDVAPGTGASGGVLAGRAADGPTLHGPRMPVAPRPSGLAARPAYWAVLAGPWVGWLAAAAIARARRRVRRSAPAHPRARLAAARRGVAAGAHGSVPAAHAAIDAALAATGPGSDPEIARAAGDARAALDAAGYARGSLAEAAAAIARLEARVPRPARVRPAARRARTLLCLALMLLAPAIHAARAQSGEEPEVATWRAANQAYRAGRFDAAAAVYRALLVQHADPRLEADLAAALWRDGQRGSAVLHYERALERAPRAAAIRRDLARLRSELGNPPGRTAADRPLLGYVRLDELLLALLGASGVAFAGLLLGVRTGRRWPAAAGLALVVLLATAAGARGWSTGRVSRGVALVDAALTAAPQGPAVARVPEGSVVQILEQRAEGWRVRAPGRPAGWVAPVEIAPLHSSASDPALP